MLPFRVKGLKCGTSLGTKASTVVYDRSRLSGLEFVKKGVSLVEVGTHHFWRGALPYC